MNKGWPALAVLALLVVLPGPAAAQAPTQVPQAVTLKVQAPDHALVPDQPTPMTVWVTARCDLVLGVPDPATPVSATIAWTALDGLSFSGPPQLDFDPALCPPGTLEATVRGDYLVVASMAVPALRQLTVSAVARVGDGASTAVPFTLQAAYASRSTAEASALLYSCSPCHGIDARIDIANLGNACTTYRFEWAEGSGPGDGWLAELPGPLIVHSAADAELPNCADESIRPASHAGMAVQGRGPDHTFDLIVRPSATADPSLVGDPLQVSFRVHHRSVGGHATPDLAAPLTALGLLALALVSRRRP